MVFTILSVLCWLEPVKLDVMTNSQLQWLNTNGLFFTPLTVQCGLMSKQPSTCTFRDPDSSLLMAPPSSGSFQFSYNWGKSKDHVWEIFMAKVQKECMALLFTFSWSKLSHMGSPNCRRGLSDVAMSPQRRRKDKYQWILIICHKWLLNFTTTYTKQSLSYQYSTYTQLANQHLFLLHMIPFGIFYSTVFHLKILVVLHQISFTTCQSENRYSGL